uniref:Phosphoinositide phospholipase C n=1 Tax=Noccaea caerulescens TaxID=107243 RepID=A0A1J3DXN5_NOCCA
MKESFKVCFCCVRSFKVKSSEPPEEIKTLFHEYSQNDRMSADEMLRFVIEVQGEKQADLNYVKDFFHRLKHHGVFHPRGLHLEGFYRYLLSDFNSPLPVTREVWQDMNQPLSHYFLYTGHNSYLTGNQLNSRSSIEPIVKALRRGVRVIELDLWPNSSGNEAEVRHGGTLTSTEDLQKCLNAVKENAFQVSDYPVVLTLEDHLPPNLQKKVAMMVSKTFGKTLFRCTDEHTECFPSPEALKNKILISTKPPKEYLQTQVSQGSTTDESVKVKKAADAEEQIQDEDEETVAIEYRDLISIHAGNRKGGLKNCLNGDPNRVIRLSMSEQWLETLAKTRGPDLVKFTQRNILRIFPKTTRFDSSNYDPLVGWIHGAQMVAFNMQSHGKYLWMMQGMFKGNGGCGYVKKPDVLLSIGPDGEIFDPCSQNLQIKTTLKVKMYTGEGWNLDFPLDHFDRYSPPDFYAKVGIAGVPLDTTSYRTETDTDEWFPVWDKEFEFPLRVPELALFYITVKDYDSNTQNDFAGQICLPLSEIRPGVRAVRLHDRAGEVYKHVRLLVRFVLEPL